MLVFNVTFKCKSGMREEFLKKIRTEGIEKYRDADAVAAHVRQAHTARLVELKTAYVSDMILEKYETEQK